MRAQRIWFLACVPLMFVIVSLAGMVNTSVGQTAYSVQAYTYGTASVSPNQGYYGDSINLTGSGQLPDVTLDAYLSGTNGSQAYYAFLGTAGTDAAGNWALSFVIPTTVIRQSDGVAEPTMVANWPVGASVVQDGYIYDSYTYVYVLGPRPAAVPLPSTGFPFLLVVLGAPLMISGGVGLRIHRCRRS